MSSPLENEVAEIGVRLLDDAYMAWFCAESLTDQALRSWFEAAPGDRGRRYFAYRAALDREEAAAHDLHRLWQLSKPCRDTLDGREQGVLSGLPPQHRLS